jgi:hypothetical protein
MIKIYIFISDSHLNLKIYFYLLVFTRGEGIRASIYNLILKFEIIYKYIIHLREFQRIKEKNLQIIKYGH